MNQQKDLLSIGTFSELTRLSIKALRLYNQLGILRPTHTDPQTGYRYYDPDQIPRARMIRNMRDMDMPLAEIRRVLDVTAVSQAQAELVIRQYLDQRIRQLEPREIPNTTPNWGISRCQPIGDPGEYSITDAWRKLSGSTSNRAPTRARNGNKNDGISAAVLMSRSPNSYSHPKLAVRRLPVN